MFLIGTTILNLTLTLCAKSELEDRLFKQLFYYWISLFINYLMTAVLTHSPMEIAFSYFFHCVPTFILANILIRSRGIDFNWNPYLVAQGVCAIISTGLILITPNNFTSNLIPITISTALPLVHPAYDTLVTNRRSSNKIEKVLAVIFITGIIHHFNFAFFRLNPEAGIWGWPISIIQYQCLMVILPLLTIHQNKLKERENLVNALNQLIGSNKMMNMKVESLYEALNNQISQKNKLLIGLNEQREMNELLIRTVSHDVATPLTVINAYTDLLSSGRVAIEDQARTFEKIRSNSQAAQNILARIKDNILARGTQKISTLKLVNLKEVLNECVQRFESRLQQKNLQIKMSPISSQLHIMADRDILIEHVFSNVMANAIKFSHQGSAIDIQVNEDPDYVVVVFKDYGIGIAPERLKEGRLESTQGTIGEQGTGYGIKVTSYFTKLQDAQFRLASPGLNLGTEATFTFKKVKSNT